MIQDTSSSSLKFLGIKFDDKLTFEKHICNITSSIAKKTGLIRKCYKTLGNNYTVLKSFYAFILPCFEYCSPVWYFASKSYLKKLDRALNNICFFLSDLLINLEIWRKYSLVCLCYIKFYKTLTIHFIANSLNFQNQFILHGRMIDFWRSLV